MTSRFPGGTHMPSTSAESSSSTLGLCEFTLARDSSELSHMSSESAPALVGLTPAWDLSESSHMLSGSSPAWDPSSRFSPRTSAPSRPKHWLDEPKLQTSRLKLKTNDPSVQTPYVEFLGVENDLVKVREKVEVKFLAFESVGPLPPTSKGDLVIPKCGEMRGIYFKVVQLTGDLCVVRKPGTRPTKSNPDVNFAISDLVQVYPAPR